MRAIQVVVIVCALGAVLTVRRGGRAIAKRLVGDERLGGLALAPSGDLIVVFHSLRSLVVPLD